MIRLVLVVVLLAAGCDSLELRGGRYPEACSSVDMPEVRCRGLVEQAAQIAGVDASDVEAFRFLPPQGDAASLGRRVAAVVELATADGQRHTESVYCTGVSSPDDRVCADDPMIAIHAGISTDVPCTGEPPAGCATPPPTPRPASVAGARPLRTASLDIPLDRAGPHSVSLGRAGLPDGYLSESRASVADPRPLDYWVTGARLVIRPVDPNRPPVGSRYREPFDGVEEVEVFLEFVVEHASPGAVLELRDVVVR